jgi:hypothetical protein
VVNKIEQPLAQTIWVKVPFTDEQKITLGSLMAEAVKMIIGKEAELEVLKEQFKEAADEIKESIGGFDSDLRTAALKLRNGFEEVKKECIVRYEDNVAKYYDKDTGVLVDEHEMTEAEQLRLSGRMVDADAVIRAESEED